MFSNDNEKKMGRFQRELISLYGQYAYTYGSKDELVDVRSISTSSFDDATLLAKRHPESCITREPEGEKYLIRHQSAEFLRVPKFIGEMFSYNMKIEDFNIHFPVPVGAYDVSGLQDETWNSIGKTDFTVETVQRYIGNLYGMSSRRSINRCPLPLHELKARFENEEYMLVPFTDTACFILSASEYSYESVTAALVMEEGITKFVTGHLDDYLYNRVF